MSDIVEDAQRRVAYWRYIATNAAEIGIAVPTLDMPGVADIVEGLLSEIARLRMTDAEREALERLAPRLGESVPLPPAKRPGEVEP